MFEYIYSHREIIFKFKYVPLAQHSDGISSLAIMAETGTFVEKIWELNKANEDTSKLWFEGRVHVNAAQVFAVSYFTI